jgi:hypothetical protein
MNDSRTDRLGALSGILFPLLAIVGVAVAGGSPDFGASMNTISDFVHRHPATTQHWIGVGIEVAGLLAFTTFATFLTYVLRRAEGDEGWLPTAALGAALVAVALKLASAMPALEAAYRGRQLRPQLAALLVDMNNLAFVLTWAIEAFFLALVAAAMLRTGALPRLVGWGAAIAAVASIAAVPLAATGAANALASVFLLWTAATSITLLRRTSTVRGWRHDQVLSSGQP